MSTHSWCRRLIEGLEAADVKDLVVSPGSRSTPILLAALDSNLEIHSVIDERSAAFFALGRARGTQRPVAFLCTSGSAGAHALPAMLEARYANHKLIAITADRPPELHDCGANQTIDQQMLFASATSPALDLGMPDDSAAAGLALRRRVQQAVVLAPGPIHINAPFRKPLEPTDEERVAPLPGPAAAIIHPAQVLIKEATLHAIAQRTASASRGIIVAGPLVGCGDALQGLAAASGFVLLAESTSGARFTGSPQSQRCDAFPHILGGALHDPVLAEALRPDLILRFGAEPACTSLGRWLAQQECTVLRFTNERALRDPAGKSEMIMGEVRDACERLSAKLVPKPATEYLASWRAADESAWGKVSRCLDLVDGQLSEARAMAAILGALSPNTRLTIGNSMPVRSADMVAPGRAAKLEVLHQRGTSGIDGLIAGAIGSSDAKPSALILGDVSFSHDVASLSLAAMCGGPLRIFVIDNGGGQIFSHLPISSNANARGHHDLWRTPPSIDLQAACAAFKIPFCTADTRPSLEEALAWSSQQESCCVVRVSVSSSSMLSFTRTMSGNPNP